MLSILYTVLRTVSAPFRRPAHPQQVRDERYLAESADIHDLERRMRELDTGRGNAYGLGATGIFTR